MGSHEKLNILKNECNEMQKLLDGMDRSACNPKFFAAQKFELKKKRYEIANIERSIASEKRVSQISFERRFIIEARKRLSKDVYLEIMQSAGELK